MPSKKRNLLLVLFKGEKVDGNPFEQKTEENSTANNSNTKKTTTTEAAE